MHIPWKTIGKGALKVIELGATIGEPHAKALAALVEAVEAAYPGTAGQDKYQKVLAASDALLAVSGLSDAQKASIVAVREAFINAYVAARNAEAEIEAAYAALQAAIAAVKGA